VWALCRAKTPATHRLRETLTWFVGVSAIAQGYHKTLNKGRSKFLETKRRRKYKDINKGQVNANIDIACYLN